MKIVRRAIEALLQWAVKQEGHPVHVRTCQGCRYRGRRTCYAFGWKLEGFAPNVICPPECLHGPYQPREDA